MWYWYQVQYPYQKHTVPNFPFIRLGDRFCIIFFFLNILYFQVKNHCQFQCICKCDCNCYCYCETVFILELSTREKTHQWFQEIEKFLYPAIVLWQVTLGSQMKKASYYRENTVGISFKRYILAWRRFFRCFRFCSQQKLKKKIMKMMKKKNLSGSKRLLTI